MSIVGEAESGPDHDEDGQKVLVWNLHKKEATEVLVP